MERRATALKYISEAVELDSKGNFQGAFGKYLESIHVLALYLNDIYSSLGFERMIEKAKEVKQVLCMLHECSDRLAIVVDGQYDFFKVQIKQNEQSKGIENNNSCEIYSKRFPVFDKLQNDNKALFKRYQWRLERTNDKYMKSNLKLELERQLVENNILAKKQYDIAIKQLQKERTKNMEKEIKKLLENSQQLNEKEMEKKELYVSVLNYAKTETWPCTWKLNAYELPAYERVANVCHKIIQCHDNPLSQWLLVTQTNIKREVDSAFKEHMKYTKVLPGIADDGKTLLLKYEMQPKEIVFHTCNGCLSVPYDCLSSMEKWLSNISLELSNVIETSVQIFYVTYQSLLPEDSEEMCYKLIESYILHQIWPNLIILYRFSNLPTEYKLAHCMLHGVTELPLTNAQLQLHHECCTLLKDLINYNSITEKLRIMVQISQKLCNDSKLGADDLIPLLCQIIMKSKQIQLSAECLAIEQLFDMKCMFGEEGYALSSFLTALKYIEMQEFMDTTKID